METASPNPFLKQNGSELFCGASANGKLHPCPSSLHDEDDFGPETDVDMVDDVLLSPAIAAAKKLVAEKRDFEDDLERQRHQMSDFDDPADVDRSRDTPTPPAHEVVGNVDENIAAESGEGEESEEEWNYFCGSTQNNKDTSVNTESQDSDMTSQLNPNAAEFVPVSPSRFMMDPDPVISSSPMRGHEKSLDNVPLPSQVEFNLDIAHRPGQLDSSGIESHMWSGGITGSDDTQLVKSEPMSTNAEDGDSHVLAFEVSTNNPTEEVFGKVVGDVTHNELDSFNNKSTKYASTFGSENSDSFKDLETYSSNAVDFHPSVKVDSDLKDYCVPQEPDDSIATGTQKSTALEAPVSPCDMQTDIDSPDDNQHNQKSPELISPSDGHLEGFSVQEPTSSSGFESESGADEPETHISDDLKHSEGEGFTIEHRKSPPVQPVYFKPIHTFSDTNPFGILDNLTSPNTEKESSLIETDNLKTDTTSDFKMVDCSVDNKSDLLGDILQEVPAYIQNSKADCNALNENLLSALPTKQHTSDERDEQTLISILNESQGTDECKQIEKIIPKNDVLTATQSVFSSDTDETEHINPVFSKSACIYESKIEELETLEFKESKIIAGIEPLEMESEMKSKGNVSNAVTGLEFETSKQEFDDKVSDIIFGSKDTELAFDSGKSCDIEAVSNSSEHQAHNFEEIQFDTSKSNNKLESKYFDIHFGTDDIEFETESNDYNYTNKSEEKSVPCKEETENTIIEEENKLAGNVINDNIESVELSVNNISSECSNLIQNIEIAESIVDQDSVIQSSKEHIETSVSSATEELLNQSENLITELCEDQIAISKVTAAYDFGKDLPDLFHTVQDVQGKKDEGNEARELDEEIHNNIVLVGAEKEISNTIEIEMCSGFVKEVGAESIPVMQPELTEFPLSTRVADEIGAASKMEELASCKTETSNCVNLNVIKDISALETAVNTREELVQAVIPETENELIPQALQNEESVTGDELSELVQNKSSVLEDNEIKANKEGIEVVTNLIPTSKIDSVYKEYNQDSGFCKSAATEMQDLSKHVQSESQVQKSFQFEDTTSTVSEVVIPTLNETCVMPVTELELPQVSNDKVLKPVNETQLELYSDNVEQTPQTEESGEVPSVTETPPPTPAPGIVEEKGDKKEGLLAAAAAAAGVATAAAVVASDSKQASKKLATTTKKTVPVVSKKSLDTGSKTGAKPSLKTAGSPSRPVASKPPPQTTVTKKPSTTGVPKTTKPVASDIKTTPTATKSVTSKPSTPTSRTATTTSKPSTPHSKPATPTSRPVSANKGDISKSTLAKPTPPAKITAAKPSKPATNTVKVTDKKTLTNGDVSKPGAKKTEHSETKKLPPSASKSVATVGRPASVVAAKSPVTKTSVTAKTAVVSKTSTIAPAVQNKPKPAVSNLIKQTTKPSTPSKSQPLSVSTTLKPTDKTGKDTVNKQISSVKASTVNKVSPGNKTTLKTESRVSNTVDSSKLKSKDQVKKPMGTKKQEPTQEHIVTTTNGYTEIIETGVKKEPSVDNSNQEVVKALE